MNRKERARHTLAALRTEIPRPATELEYVNEYELLVAVMLSAQCTDARVNMVTPSFFEAFPDVDALADATEEMVYPIIKSISYPNNKSRHLVAAARRIEAEYGGKVPGTVKDLMTLPGVGRKTAQVVASVAFDEDALPVDTHVFRVANRIGLTENANTPLKVEQQLKRALPVEDWAEGHHLLILHGRYRCTARSPRCDGCPVAPYCRYYSQLSKLPDPISGIDRRRGRYYCKTRQHYFDEPSFREDRNGVNQLSCPRCGSMNVFETKNGHSTKRVRDFRV